MVETAGESHGFNNITFDGKPVKSWLKGKEDSRRGQEISKIIGADLSEKSKSMKRRHVRAKHADSNGESKTHHLTDREVREEYGMDVIGKPIIEKVIGRLVVAESKGVTIDEFMDDFPTAKNRKTVVSAFNGVAQHLSKFVTYRKENNKNRGKNKRRKHKRYFLESDNTEEWLKDRYRFNYSAHMRKLAKEKAKRKAKSKPKKTPDAIEAKTEIVELDGGAVFDIGGLVSKAVSEEMNITTGLVNKLKEKVLRLEYLMDEGISYGGVETVNSEEQHLKRAADQLHAHVLSINTIIEESKPLKLMAKFSFDGDKLNVNCYKEI